MNVSAKFKVTVFFFADTDELSRHSTDVPLMCVNWPLKERKIRRVWEEEKKAAKGDTQGLWIAAVDLQDTCLVSIVNEKRVKQNPSPRI